MPFWKSKEQLERKKLELKENRLKSRIQRTQLLIEQQRYKNKLLSIKGDQAVTKVRVKKKQSNSVMDAILDLETAKEEIKAILPAHQKGLVESFMDSDAGKNVIDVLVRNIKQPAPAQKVVEAKAPKDPILDDDYFG